MRLLAFDTSTEHLSIAVQVGEHVLAHEGAGGAQASHTLIAAIRALLARAGSGLDDMDAIVFGHGPGAFTGLRTACAVAQGLAFGARSGAGLPVLPVSTLLAVAEDARAGHGCERVLATLDARMGEVYAARCIWQGAGRGWRMEGGVRLVAPEAVDAGAGDIVAGNARAACGERLAPRARHVAALPTAAALLRLAPPLLAAGAGVAAAGALPLYVRDKVAQTTAERAAAHAGQQP